MTDMTPTTKFLNTLGQTPTISGSLVTNLTSLKNNLDEIIKVLTYPKTVDDDLTKLDNYLTQASTLLSFVEIIPEVGEAVVPLKQAIATIQPEVKSAKNAADRIEASVKPFRDALQKLDPILAQLITGTQKIQNVSQKFLTDFQAVYNCVESLPPGNARDTSEMYLNNFSTPTEPILAGLNTAMSGANSLITDFYAELNKLQQALSPLAAIDSAINSVISTLDPVIGLLQKLENDLNNIKILIPIPYPHEYSLYEIFKFFEGIGTWIEKALEPIQSLINDILKALNINIDIPGLSDILNIQINIPSIPDFTQYLTEFENELQSIMNAIANFTLKCPPEA